MAQRPAHVSSRPNSDIVTAYLTAYNVVQFLGWTALLLTAVYHLVREGEVRGLYQDSSALLKILQTGAILEIVHAAVGLVRSSAVLTGVQVFSRVFITWGILHSVQDAQDSYGYLVLLLAWSLTEAVRYPFYVCQMIGQVPYFLKWARYSLFIVLYPVGITGELLSIYSSLAHVQQTGMYSLTMPNRLNVSFSYYHSLIVYALLFIPVFPQLYLHMFGQRRKFISSPISKKD